MAGIGEASAVIGVVQIGFSLARTLSTYIGDYKDSRDSIISLAVQLDSTILHVKELNALIRSREAAGSVSEDSRKVAENAVTNSKRLIEKLVKLLTKADLPDDPDAIVNIKPGDIDVRTLTKFYWPLIKSEVEYTRLELQSMKTEILLARSCIQAQTGSTPAERAAGEESIVALTKSKRLARRLLKEAKAEEKRAAMSAQQPDYAPRPPSGPNRPSARYPSGPSRRGTYDSISDDGRETDLMARDLRESILEDLQRKDAERKAKEKAEEAARKLAIENYQQMVKEKLARLQQARDTTTQRIMKIFGHLDGDLVQKFLDEQQSGQMQDEFGETLLKIGVVPLLPPMDLTKDAGESSTGKNGVQKPKRRWFFKRRPSHASESTNMSNNGASITTSGLPNPERTKFLHIVMSYDSAEGKYSWQTLDNPALRHSPCGPTCDFDDTLRAWQTLPRSVKQAASRWVDYNFSHRVWHLHAALPIRKNIRATRRLLQKAVLGAIAPQGVASIMLVFSSTQRYDTSEKLAGDSASESSHMSAPMSDGGASRVELSQADIEQMREWLTSRGLSTAKIAGLEALIVKQKESAAAAAATQASMPYGQSSPQDDNTGHDQTDATVQADIRRQGTGSHVRFATADDVAPSTRLKSNATTVASRRSNTYDRGYAEPVSSQPVSYRTSRTHDDLRQGYRGYYPPPSPPPQGPPLYPRRLNERASEAIEDLKPMREKYEKEIQEQKFKLDQLKIKQQEAERTRDLATASDLKFFGIPDVENRIEVLEREIRIPSDDEWYDTSRHRSSRRVDDKRYGVGSLQNAYDRRNPREPNRTRTEDEWEHRDRRPQTYRQEYDTTIVDPSSYENRGRGHGLDRTRSTGHAPTPVVNVYNEVRGDPSSDDFPPPPSSRPVHFNYRHSGGRDHRGGLSDELAEELAEMRMERRNRENSDTGSRSPGRHRTGERYQLSHEYMGSRVHGRSIDDGNARREAEVRREASLRPLRTILRERPMLAPQVSHEIFTNPYDDYGRRQSNYPDLTPKLRVVYPDILSIPRQLSPEPLPDDVSDAEDAALNDAELKNKMLVKYTGGIVANTPAGPDRTGDKPQSLAGENDSKGAEENAADAGAEIDDEDVQWDTAARRKSLRLRVAPGPALPVDEPASPDSQTSGPRVPTSPTPGVQRHNTVTIEDYDSDAETGARRQRTRSSRHRPTSSPSSASSARDSPAVRASPPRPETTRDLSDRDTV